MPILKSAKKALRQSRRRYERNKRIKIRVRRWIKKFEKTLALGTKDALKQAETMLPTVQKLIDKSAKRNIFPRNKAKRMVASLYSKLETAKKELSTKK